MRLLKWLFQPVYILLIIVLVALYVNREDIFPEEIAESMEAEELVAKVEGLVERLRGDISDTEGSETEAASPQSEGEVPEEQVVVAAEDVEVAEPEPEPEPQVMMAQSEMNESEGNTFSNLNDADSDALFAMDVSQPAETAAPEPATVTTDEPVTAPDDAMQAAAQSAGEEASQSLPPLALWRAARAAVWQGDLAAAVANYQQLIAAQPGNYDAYGEMGNVLLAQANTSAATDAYASAARLIYQSGNRDMAFRVASIVAELDEVRGQSLYSEFTGR